MRESSQRRPQPAPGMALLNRIDAGVSGVSCTEVTGNRKPLLSSNLCKSQEGQFNLEITRGFTELATPTAAFPLNTSLPGFLEKRDLGAQGQLRAS